MKNMLKINWFPGHMHRAIDRLKKLKYIDAIIEVVDARAIETSTNHELKEIFPNKEVLTVALKKDLADCIANSNKNNILIASINDRDLRQRVINKLNEMLAQKKQKYQCKGVAMPIFYVLVIGLPNVGKSSLINVLNNKKVLRVENRPGVTKNNNLIKLVNNIYIYDSPGIMVKKITNVVDGYILSLINVININVLPLAEILNWWYTFCLNKYSSSLQNTFNSSFDNLSFIQFVVFLKEQYKLLEDERVYHFLYNKIVNGIFPINYEIQ